MAEFFVRMVFTLVRFLQMIIEVGQEALLKIFQKQSPLKLIFVRHVQKIMGICFRLGKKVDK